MKKLLALIFVFLMIVSGCLSGCKQAEEEENFFEQVIQVEDGCFTFRNYQVSTSLEDMLKQLKLTRQNVYPLYDDQHPVKHVLHHLEAKKPFVSIQEDLAFGRDQLMYGAYWLEFPSEDSEAVREMLDRQLKAFLPEALQGNVHEAANPKEWTGKDNSKLQMRYIDKYHEGTARIIIDIIPSRK